MQRTIDGLCVTIIRKSIKSMHLRVLSPNGEIQITAPNRLSVSQIDRFVREKRAWIAARQQQLAARPAATNPAFADGQTVYLWGEAYTLRLEAAARGRSVLQRRQEIVLSIRPEGLLPGGAVGENCRAAPSLGGKDGAASIGVAD